MPKQIRFKLLLIFLLLWLVLTIPGVISARNRNTYVKISSVEQPISVKIMYAYYCDLDQDGFEDDIYAKVSLSMYDASFYAIEYYVNLTLPSNVSFTYRVIINTDSSELMLHNLFYNHATESGNYSLFVQVVLKNGGMATDSHLFVFDPPGGSDGADPSFDLV